MPAFSIHCTTCKSRLKVRDESAIGQIVACPKCGSMVMIEAPSESAVAPLAAADLPDTVADSKLGNSFEEAASWFDDDAPAEPPAEKATSQPEPPAADAEPVAAAAHVTPPTAPPPPAEQMQAEPPSAPLMPGDAWTSASTANMKRIGMVVGASVLGIVGVVGLAIAVTSASGTGEPDPVEIAELPIDPAETPVEIEPLPADVPPEPEPIAPVEPEPEPAPTERAEIEVPLTPVAPSVEPVDPPAEVPEPPLVPEEVNEEPIVTEPPVEPPSETEPPLFAEQPAPAAPAPTNSGLAALDALLPYLDAPPPAVNQPNDPPPAEPIPPSETRDPLLEPNPADPQEPVDPNPVKPEPRIVDVTARLNDPIEAIEFPATPLVDFLRLLSDFSTIPITLDPVALTQLKISPDDQIAVVMGKTTVGDVLRQAAARKNLTLEVSDDQITVTHNRDMSGSLRQAKYNVSDLSGQDPKSLESLRQMILVHIAPGTWQETGGVGEIESVPGALLIRHTEPVHHAAVVFIEKLRLARGLPLRSSYDPLLFDREGRRAACNEKLAQTVSVNYFELTRLTTVIERLETLGGVHITVDWPALLANGWTPDTEATLSVADAPLGEAISKLLDPRDLTYDVIAPTWIQITTADAIASKREVEFYSVADLLGRKAWGASDLQAAVLAELPLDSAAVRPVLGFDDASGSLIVSAAPPSLREIRRILDDM